MSHDNHDGPAFKPVIRENQILAGGLRIAEVDSEGRLVFVDPYRRRRYARGTDAVPVDLLDLLEALIDHYRRCPW